MKRFSNRLSPASLAPQDGRNQIAALDKPAALWQRVEQLIADHPTQSLIAALAAGALLGWISKRR